MYYRIKIAIDNLGDKTYMPQVKHHFFDKWCGIIVFDPGFTGDEYNKVRSFSTINGGIFLNKETEAQYFIERYEKQRQKTKKKYHYKKVNIQNIKY